MTSLNFTLKIKMAQQLNARTKKKIISSYGFFFFFFFFFWKDNLGCEHNNVSC